MPPFQSSSAADVRLPISLQASEAPSQPCPDPIQLVGRHRPPGLLQPSEPHEFLVSIACCSLPSVQCGHPLAVESAHTIVWLVQCFVVLSFQLFAFHAVVVAISLKHGLAMPFGCFRLVVWCARPLVVRPPSSDDNCFPPLPSPVNPTTAPTVQGLLDWPVAETNFVEHSEHCTDANLVESVGP